MCRYNQWMNEKLYAVCETIPDEVRKEDRGAFFRSIHGTLNHLLLTDRLWLGRFHNRPYPFKSLDEELYDDFGVLRQERVKTDNDLLAWVATLTEEIVAAPFIYTNYQGQSMTFPYWILVAHLFNHQTHHRGQITTLLNQAGYDSGPTDLPLMPGARIDTV